MSTGHQYVHKVLLMHTDRWHTYNCTHYHTVILAYYSVQSGNTNIVITSNSDWETSGYRKTNERKGEKRATHTANIE